jgi:hypothetical protein
MAGPVKMATSDHQDTAFSALSSHVFEQIDLTVRSQQLILKKKTQIVTNNCPKRRVPLHANCDSCNFDTRNWKKQGPTVSLILYHRF